LVGNEVERPTSVFIADVDLVETVEGVIPSTVWLEPMNKGHSLIAYGQASRDSGEVGRVRT
jgi:hypothetical protein